MSKGTSATIMICGARVALGDHLKVRYTSGTWSKGATIEGDVVELWSYEHDNHLQCQLSCGWCFHDNDEILEQRDQP